MFSKQLLLKLNQWRLVGSKSVLFAYLNEDIYDGKIAQLFGAAGLYIEEVVQKSTGHKTPYSHTI